MAKGQCRLCGEVEDLVKSHIVPESFWRTVSPPTEPAMMVTNTPGMYPKRTPIGVYDRIVCERCEQAFGPYDNYASTYLLDGRTPAEDIVHASNVIGVALPTPNYGLLKLFLISVLWRAHCSTQAFYNRVDLGPLASSLGTRIQNGDPGSPDDCAVVFATFDDPLGHNPMDPHPERIDGIKVYRFYLGEYIAYIKADRRPLSEGLRSLQLAPDRKLCVIRRTFRGSKELEVLEDMIAKSRALRSMKS